VPELSDIAARIAADARPGEQVEAYVGWSRQMHARAYDGHLETLSSAESAGVGVRVVSGKRQGFAYAGSLDDEAAREVLAEARDNASFASEDEHAGLAEPDAVDAAPLELWRDSLGALPTDAKTQLALDLERRLNGSDPRIRKVVEADYDDSASEFAIASSTGITGSGRRTRCNLYAQVIADDGTGDQTGWSYSIGRGPEDLDSETVADECVRRALRLLGARKPESATLTAVLDPRVTATLLGIVARALSGGELVKGRSMFAGRVGELVATPAFHLVEDPTDPEATGATATDSEGLACRPVGLIEDGVLRRFLFDTRAARMAGEVSTASAVRAGFKSTPDVGARALALRPGTLDQPALLASVGDGLYIEHVSGVHSGVNHVSGDFSVGARGLMIRDGALAEPVRELTIASTLQRMLQHVVEIGSDVEHLPQNATGVTIAIGEMAMSGA
jgi:PmbA protein